MKYLIYYLLTINIMGFVIYGIDKYAAKSNRRRISERCLFFLAFFGGCLGTLVGMFLFRHKTKKIKFYIWNLFNLIIWVYFVFRIILVSL